MHEPTNAEVMAVLDRTHDELVVRKEIDDRWRRIVKRLLAWGLVAMALLLVMVIALGTVAFGNRGLLKASNGQSEDNLRASIAVGSCVREQAPDMEACSLARFRAATAAAKARR